MLYLILISIVTLVSWSWYERIKYRAQMIRIHYEWIALAEDAERAAVEAEDAAPTLTYDFVSKSNGSYGTPEAHRAHVALLSIANMYWTAAATYRVNAGKYIKYLPQEDREFARVDNTWSGHNTDRVKTEAYHGQNVH